MNKNQWKYFCSWGHRQEKKTGKLVGLIRNLSLIRRFIERACRSFSALIKPPWGTISSSQCSSDWGKHSKYSPSSSGDYHPLIESSGKWKRLQMESILGWKFTWGVLVLCVHGSFLASKTIRNIRWIWKFPGKSIKVHPPEVGRGITYLEQEANALPSCQFSCQNGSLDRGWHTRWFLREGTQTQSAKSSQSTTKILESEDHAKAIFHSVLPTGWDPPALEGETKEVKNESQGGCQDHFLYLLPPGLFSFCHSVAPSTGCMSVTLGKFRKYPYLVPYQTKYIRISGRWSPNTHLF